MNILVTLDSNYVPHLIVLFKSLMASNPAARFDIYVAHSSLTQDDFRAMNESIDMSRTVIHPIKVRDELFENAPILKRTSKETYFRLLIAEFLPETVDRILYIDPDTVVIKPLDTLYNIDFGNNIIAAAGHTSGIIEALNHKRLHIGRQMRYINAGIMMMNVALMRKTVRTADIFDYISKNAKKLYLADQDVINGMFWKRIRLIDECLYNLDEKTVTRHKLGDRPDWIEQNAVIIHFNGSQKPWKEKYKGVLGGYYFRYKNMNPCFFNRGGSPGKSSKKKGIPA